jgi:hypothetical protein
MPTWLEQKPIKNHRQPIGTLARGPQKKITFWCQKLHFDSHFCAPRAGQSFKPKSAIFFCNKAPMAPTTSAQLSTGNTVKIS